MRPKVWYLIGDVVETKDPKMILKHFDVFLNEKMPLYQKRGYKIIVLRDFRCINCGNPVEITHSVETDAKFIRIDNPQDKVLMVAVACPKCVNKIMEEQAIKNIKLQGVIWNQDLGLDKHG